MEILKNIVEYYDELYPISEEQYKFYIKLKSQYSMPVKILHIGCGVGTLEHELSKDGADVTGIETSTELINLANLKRRTQLMSLRFFQLEISEISRYLGKHFYNIISCLNSKLAFIKSSQEIKSFFFDCKDLLAENGTLVLQLYNFHAMENEKTTELKSRESNRALLFQHLTRKEAQVFLTQKIKTGNGKIISVREDEEVFPVSKEDIESFAKEAGFTTIQFYNSFNLD
ncbi:MAG: methyltransferase domain-containing protein, partial [Treponema sp.]|nr:methyltransferase domain-containing protein [Treponema sp.]